MGLNFGQTARSAAIAWKLGSRVVPDGAREAADWVRPDGRVTHGPFEFCLPLSHAGANLLPEAAAAVEIFASLGLPWPGGVDGGPGNQLLDPWVQCANTLVPLTGDAERVALLLAQALAVDEVLPIENGWYVTFGWTGLTDHLAEHGGATPPRGAASPTHAHAAVKYRTPAGDTEVALLAWYYAESFRDATPEPPRKLAARAAHHRGLIAPDVPLLRPHARLADFLIEPFDHLLRLHLLARGMEAAGELEADRVRVVMVAPSENLDLARSLQPAHHSLGATVADVWRAALVDPEADRFAELDSAVLLDPALDLTSEEFRSRYADLEPKVEDLETELAWRAGRADTPHLVEKGAPSWDRRRRRG